MIGEAEEKEEVAIKEEAAGIAKAVLFINQKGFMLFIVELHLLL